MKKTIVSYALAAAGVLTLGLATGARAATTITTNIAVTATVQSNCTISAAPLAFGNYTGAVNNAASTITATCTNTTPYDIGLNAGTATGATVTSRKMTGPSSALLNYSITSDAGHVTNWGNTIGTDAVHGVGTGAVQTLNVYGQIPAAQFVTPGSYADTITASLTY
jgi:spore coat protein U-like protein